ncbi:MAG: nucleoside hydrolase [Candidatus Pristimantibacillus lignocellulolyticus]|uniref:Nucleoside hydrolase n=1 Tax=Candidatus Pristimantibacillus lignocellulolyticus TaxID=2994561 RepID=A0A9J6ZKG0_9BACL|nr:MAG: nucleoside hydrolase [Candidatus Pristimantibacillus lignocellulolyticus]
MSAVHKMIIDADTGIDDSIAILHALKAKDVRLEGITTVFGNSSVDQATENTIRLIQLAQPGYEVPVAKGAAKPLVREWAGPVVHVHGNNGIGNVELPPSGQQPIAESAAQFIVRKANEMPGEITLVTLGRLTNVALALELDPDLPQKLKHVVTMGGTVFAPGNVTPVVEANLRGDPEAIDRVIRSGISMTLVGLDVTMKAKLNKQHLENLAQVCRSENTAIVQYMQDVIQYYFSYYSLECNLTDTCPLHDPLAILVARIPEIARMQQMKVQIECEGTITAGAVIADLRTNPSNGDDIMVCLDVNPEQVVNELLSVF